MNVHPDFDSNDFYVRLGIDSTASDQEIKKAYLALVRQYTPERAPEAFKRIREAYETLSNPAARKQYDAKPDPRIVALIKQASEAMKQEDYPTAEQAYKQILIEVPDLDWIRNLLGLCFLYQSQPEKAVQQYERLIRQGSDDPSVHSNAAHAYRALKQYPAAEREFRLAMSLSGEQSFEHGLSLIQALIEAERFADADHFALTEANKAAAGSLAASEYLARRIDLALLLDKKENIPAILERMSKVAGDEQKRVAAFALGKACSRLISHEVFSTAEAVAKAARGLQPDDMDYDGQEQVCLLLGTNDLEGAMRLLRTHVAFAEDGWLEHLRPRIEHYCQKHAAFQGMKPIKTPPTLQTINGIGTTIYGNRDADSATGTYVATQYFVFVFVPLFPIASYRVKPSPTGGWYFLGKVPYAQPQKLHWAAFLGLLLVWFLSSLGGSSSARPTPSYASSSGAGSPAPYLPIAPLPSSSSVGVYEGTATNTNVQRTSPITFRFQNWTESPNGHLDISPPLGGSGPFVMMTAGDTVKIASFSAEGDTIIWIGLRSGNLIDGGYTIVGGQFEDQHGTWHVTRSTGQRIPDVVELPD